VGDLSEVELWILRYMNQAGSATRQTAAEIAPNVGLSVEATTDRLNELEWVGYVEDHGTTDGADLAFTLTTDGIEAASS